MTTTAERHIDVESVRVPNVRGTFGNLDSLGASIRDEGLRNPIVLWRNGLLLAGSRRHRAHLLLGGKHRSIQAVFVDTIEDAAKALLHDSEDDYQALPMKASEVCRLWEVLRDLDGPAAARRADDGRRRGVELRRQTQNGKRQPGRGKPTPDYVADLLAPAFGMSLTTAKRLWSIYGAAIGLTDTSAEKAEQARKALESIDAGESSIWANYVRLVDPRTSAIPLMRAPAPAEPVPAARQIAAWSKSLPQMEGLVAGLVELGSPNAELTWEQVGPVHARLMKVRRDMEKIIKQMRENKA